MRWWFEWAKTVWNLFAMKFVRSTSVHLMKGYLCSTWISNERGKIPNHVVVNHHNHSFSIYIYIYIYNFTLLQKYKCRSIKRPTPGFSSWRKSPYCIIISMLNPHPHPHQRHSTLVIWINKCVSKVRSDAKLHWLLAYVFFLIRVHFHMFPRLPCNNRCIFALITLIYSFSRSEFSSGILIQN